MVQKVGVFYVGEFTHRVNSYVGPGKVTPCLGSLTYPEIETPFRKDLQLLVSHPKYFQLPESMLGVFVGIFMAVHFQVHRVQIKCSLF